MKGILGLRMRHEMKTPDKYTIAYKMGVGNKSRGIGKFFKN